MEEWIELPDPIDFDLEEIKKRGVLHAIIENSSTSYFIYKGQPMGYEHDLLMLLAEELGVDIKFIVMPDIKQAFIKLNEGEGDLIAFNLTITKERKKFLSFTDYHVMTRQVLVQRKPENWRQMKLHEIERELIRNPIDLIGKEIHVRRNSSYESRLRNLSDEVGGEIILIEDFGGMDTESLIQKVVEGEIERTVADENIAMVNATYFPILDVETPISFPQRIAWGLRKNSPELEKSINQWIRKMKKQPDYYAIYDRYFKSSKSSMRRMRSDFQSITGDNLSPYDSIIKVAADSLGWDWRLLAAQVFKESRFDPEAISWAGAQGLMQLMPTTALEFGAQNPFDPQQSIMAGLRYLKWLDRLWADRVEDADERSKFILASFNVGQGHVLDAVRLAEKHNKNGKKWEDVAEFLLKKSTPEYYNDPVVHSGYCRGEEPVNYVRDIFRLYENYLQLVGV